jgi:hypothetical protein
VVDGGSASVGAPRENTKGRVLDDCRPVRYASTIRSMICDDDDQRDT